jgi:hypothetical protein
VGGHPPISALMDHGIANVGKFAVFENAKVVLLRELLQSHRGLGSPIGDDVTMGLQAADVLADSRREGKQLCGCCHIGRDAQICLLCHHDFKQSSPSGVCLG